MSFAMAILMAAEAIEYVESFGMGEKAAFQKIMKESGAGERRVMKQSYRLYFETIKRLNFIDMILRRFIGSGKLDKCGNDALNLLRIFVYLSKFSITSVNDYLKQVIDARKFLGEKMKCFEGFLGDLFRFNPETLLDDLEDEERTALKYFHPPWFVKYCFKRFGRDFSLKFLESNNGVIPRYLMINPIMGDVDSIVRLVGEKAKIVAVNDLDRVYRIDDDGGGLVGSDLWRKGYFRIQDKSSFLPVLCLDPDPEAVILDVCAAPGGKTAYLAGIMGNQGRIYSLDYSGRRMKAWRREVERLGIKNAHPVICDIIDFAPLRVQVDAALVDPPCSGTGVFMKYPMGKWRLDLGKIEGFQRLQLNILSSTARFVRVGGVVVYSTCSVMVEENEHVIRRFLALRPDFEVEGMSPFIGCPGLEGFEKCQRLYPHLHESNGFFLARLKRTE